MILSKSMEMNMRIMMTKDKFFETIQSYCLVELPFTYWYPLNKIKENIPVIAYDLDKIYTDDQIEEIEKVLKDCSINMVTMFQNQDYKTMSETLSLNKRLYERDSDGCVFPWHVECYYYDKSKSWMIYVSHEATITFTGEEIVRIAKATIDTKYLV